MPTLRCLIEACWKFYQNPFGLPRLQLAEGIRQPLVFFHIPRTGGISFHQILLRIEGPRGVAPHVGSDQALLDRLAAAPDFFRRYSMFAGHFSSRILPFVPSAAAKLVFLRHPAALLRSTYHLLRGFALEVGAPVFDSSESFAADFCVRNSFEDFIASSDPRLAAHTRNPQTRMLGFDNAFDPTRNGDPELLARAKDTLASFEFVGITERYSEALRIFESRYLRAPIRRFYVYNASPRSPSLADSMRTRKIVGEVCGLDLALYAHACGILDCQLAALPSAAGTRLARALPYPKLGR